VPPAAWTLIRDTIDWRIMGPHTSHSRHSRPWSSVLAVPILLMAISAFGQEVVKAPRAKTAKSRIPDVVYIPTPDDVVDRMLRLAAVTKDDVVYDLGCGDGRIVIAAARKYGCRTVGVDVDPLRVNAAERNVRKHGVEKLVTIRQQDLFAVDLSQAIVITLYLSTRYNTRLVPELNKTKPGSRVVSHLFGIEGVTPDKVVTVRSKHDRHEHRLLLWTTPFVSGGSHGSDANVERRMNNPEQSN
jgi:SAM-dependent methyltransferase